MKSIAKFGLLLFSGLIFGADPKDMHRAPATAAAAAALSTDYHSSHLPRDLAGPARPPEAFMNHAVILSGYRRWCGGERERFHA